jgi:hypothetical protein
MRDEQLHYGGAFLSAGLLLGIVDAVFLLLSRKMFFDISEMGRAVFLAVSMDTALAVLFGAAAFGIVTLACYIFAKLDWQNSPLLKIAAVSSLIFGPFIFILLRLTAGPQASQASGRIIGVFFTAAILSFTFSYFIIVILKWFSVSPRRKKFAKAVFAGVAVILAAADALILVRLYPMFHGVLTVLSFLVCGMGFVIGMSPPRGPRKKVAAAVVIAASFAIGLFSSVYVLKTQNIRFVIGYATPNASDLSALIQHLVSMAKGDEESDDKELDSRFRTLSNGAELSLPGADVFLISIDAMRYDRLMSIGAKREVAPNIDRFAKTAVVFQRAYTPIPHTSYAITSMLTGKYTRPLFEVPGTPPVHETWPEIMHRFRYDTAAFFTPAIFFIDRARFEPYFRSGLGFSYRKVETKQTAAERVAALEAYLEEKKNSKTPQFAWIHFFEPHEPYDPECTRFGTSAEDRYDCEIWTVDKAVGDLLSYIEKSKPNSIVIVTADHGEEFLDHGGSFHGTTLFDEQVRVPLVMRIPGVTPRSVNTPVGLTDLLGTVLSMVDIPIPARVRSRDLTDIILNGNTAMDAYSEVHDESMVVFDGYKIICDVKNDLCRLYDLNKDSKETASIAEQNPQKTNELKKRLLAWRRSHARYELRPVSMEKGGEKWPDAVKRALGGDVSAVRDLFTVVSSSKENVIRRKAAELAFKLSENLPQNVALNKDEKDPETNAWIKALLAKFGDKEAQKALPEIAKQLDKKSEVFRSVALVRLRFGDLSAYDDLLSVALDDTAAIEERQQSIRSIASVEKRASADKLIPLINNYQLTLDTAEALGTLKIKSAVGSLITRLKRERFLERKAAIIKALADIGDWRAVSAIADELQDETPPPNVLEALARMTELSPFGRKLHPSKSSKEPEVIFYRPAPKDVFTVYLKEIRRVAVRTTSLGDGGAVSIRCGKDEMGTVPITAGSLEGIVDVSRCRKQAGKPFELSLQMNVASDKASIDMVAVIGK